MKEEAKKCSPDIKTAAQILEQAYVSAYDLQMLIPTFTYKNALDYIVRIRNIMEEKKYFLPPGRTKLALTKLVKKDLGI